MENSNNIYSGYAGYQQWFKPEGERKTPLPLPVEIHLSILGYLTNPQQLEMRLVSKDWAVLSATHLTRHLSDEPSTTPLAFVNEFLEKIKKQFFFVHTKVEPVDLVGDVPLPMNTPMDLVMAIADSVGEKMYDRASIFNKGLKEEIFPEGWKVSLYELAAGEHQQFLSALIEKSFEVSFLSHGFYDNNRRFILNRAKKAGSSIFSNEDINCAFLCYKMKKSKDSLKRIELANFDESQHLSSKTLTTIFLTLKELKKFDVLDLRGLRIDETCMKYLIELLGENTNIKSVHVTKQCLLDSSYSLLKDQKPKRKNLKITVHIKFPKENSPPVDTENEGHIVY